MSHRNFSHWIRRHLLSLTKLYVYFIPKWYIEKICWCFFVLESQALYSFIKTKWYRRDTDVFFACHLGEVVFFSIFIDISRGLIYSYHAKDLNISYCKGQGYFKTMSLLHKYTALNFSHVTSPTWHLSNIQTPYFIFPLNEFPTKYLNANELLIIIINSKGIQMNKFNKTQAQR